MTPSGLRAKIIAERAAWVRRMTAGIRALPLDTYDAFHADPRNAAAAESHLRRALEALLDLGRHVLAKGFGRAVTEYKDVARSLAETGVLDDSHVSLLRRLAGYRNRLVHFYHEVSEMELYEICTGELEDVNMVLTAILAWIEAHPESVDHSL
ncbi:MAG: hypothetical protein H6Q86_1115 [candidate division NC10 bacterium]|jgi:uncharacterized protein YutE (UPF0331/DUF86 family)|nr:hypothetical protein [candidate division NC10 bacterium]